MATEKVDVMVSGGKATAAPPLGPALGPLKVNIGDVVNKINEKTKSFAGMQVPVTVEVDTETKEFTITVGTPPASALIKQEAGVQKASGNPKAEHVADLAIEQVIKIAKMKEDALLGKDLKQMVKEIVGTCQSMGIYVEGKHAPDAIAEINAGKFDAEIKAEKTEISAEEQKQLEEERKHLEEEMKEKREEFTAKAKEIVGSMSGKDAREIRKALQEAEIPQPIIDELAPEEEKK
jgi:large subunit ribosomal protein L11